MGDIFSIETRKYAWFCEVCVKADGCRLDQCENIDTWNNGKFSLLMAREAL